MTIDVLTITLNPAIDETAFVERFTPGAVHRARAFRRQAAGKGVNVALMLAAAGLDVAVTGFLGADNASVFERALAGVDDRFVRVPGETRTGIKIVDDATRATTDVNLPGLAPTRAHLSALHDVVRASVRPGLWVVLAGSLPPGVEPSDLADLVVLARSLGARVAVDTSGPALAAAVAAGVDLVKPNQHELADIAGRALADFADVLAVATALPVAHVIVSLGHEGALFLLPEERLHASPPPVRVVSTVGAGDSLLAGYLAALVRDEPPAARARLATVFAWCALESIERTLVDASERAARAARISVRAL